MLNKKAVCVVCSFIIMISSGLLVCWLAFSQTYGNTSYYDRILKESGYYAAESTKIESSLQEKAHTYGMPADVVANAVTSDDVKEATGKLINKYTEFMQGKIQRITIRDVSDKTIDRLCTRLQKYAVKNGADNASVSNTILDYTKSCRSEFLSLIMPLPYFKTLLTYARSYMPCFNMFSFICGVLLGVSAILLIAINRKKEFAAFLYIMYGTISGGALTAIATLFVLAKKYFYTARFSDEYLRNTLGNIISGFFSTAFVFGTVLCMASIIVSLAANTIHSKKRVNQEKVQNDI